MSASRTSSAIVRPLRREKTARLHPSLVFLLAAAAVVGQAILPAYIPLVRLLDLPLLVVLYVALLRRHILFGMFVGLAVGLAQDGLSHGPIGLFGMIKSIVGYAAGSVSLFIETNYPGARAVLAALFFLVHQVLFWAVQGGLLGGEVVFDPARLLILAAIHAGLALILYRAFDGLTRVE